MLKSIFNLGRNRKQMNKTSQIKHYVLGTVLDSPLKQNEDEIIFGCGCFWGAEKGFWKLPGVITTSVGYAGGKTTDPNYNQICTGMTGHAEVVRVVWNKLEIDLSDLLKLFWECHNPTQGNRQGNDRGSQYRSVIYSNNPDHSKLILASKYGYQKNLAIHGIGEISTEICTDKTFYYAEEYHQQYLAKPGSRQYCSAMPTKVKLDEFEGANFKLKKDVWQNYNWSETHCVLRSTVSPIRV